MGNAERALMGFHYHVGNTEKVLMGFHFHVGNTEKALMGFHYHVGNAEKALRRFHYHVGNAERALMGFHYHVGNTEKTLRELHQPRLWFITGGYLVKRWFTPAASRARGQSNDLNREILDSNIFNCHKEVINTPPVPSISRCIHIVYRHKNV